MLFFAIVSNAAHRRRPQERREAGGERRQRGTQREGRKGQGKEGTQARPSEAQARRWVMDAWVVLLL
jgi:hypothetical protein